MCIPESLPMPSDQISSQPLPEPPPLPAAEEGLSVFEASSQDRQLAVVCHVCGYFTSFIVPLVIYKTAQRRSLFIMHHAREALNFQISQILYYSGLMVVASLVALLTGLTAGMEVGLIVAGVVLALAGLAFGFVETILVIMACVGAARGRFYRYPLCIRLVQ
jgi:uncharacterized protein